ncbi:hypothetical protein [Companilactobacillus furfuricola]|nr:hypothetical protein [Companilactobacillus furfuricola]
MTDDEKKKDIPVFEQLGGANESGVCGPEGCNIEDHRKMVEKGSADNKE